MEETSEKTSEKILPNPSLINTSKDNIIPFDAKVQKKIIEVTKKDEVFEKLLNNEKLIKSVLFIIENGGTKYERELLRKYLPKFEKLISPETIKALQLEFAHSEDYLKRMIKIYHGLFNNERIMSGHLFENLTYNEKDKYDENKNGKLHQISSSDNTIVFYTLIYELILEKVEYKPLPTNKK